ncbi:MAG TPA: CoA transferase [Dehalococcoidia bacterium]|nr:CoA transferase [Dehalococcoidia bacterium]
MPGPMEGVKVVEFGVWVAAPSAAALLADWGADVIKIEPPEGDPFRGLMAGLSDSGSNPPFELDNRGKRSVALNLRTVEARAIAYQILAEADVFITNARPAALVRSGLDFPTLSERFPRLIYAQLTGYGADSDERDRAAFDVGAFWARAGIAALLTPDGADFPMQRGGMGDHTAGAQLCAGICAALYHRERTGEGQRVAVSLARTGVYTIGWDINIALRTGVPPGPMTRRTIPNPLIAPYRAGDGRAFWLLMLQGDRHWPDFCRAVGRPDWEHDERFSNLIARAMNCGALSEEIDRVLATKPYAEWAAIFDREDIWYAPVQGPAEVVDDPVMAQAGAFVDVPLGAGGTARMVATPVDFDGTPWEPGGPVPELGQHTEEVLLELGHDWGEIANLKELGAIP